MQGLEYSLSLFALISLTFHPTGAIAGRLPVWKPQELVLYSDVVVVGTELDDGVIRVDKLLKGKWAAKTIRPTVLDGYKKGFLGVGEGGPKLKFTGKLVLFLSLRWGRPDIVANGVYRQAQEGVFGYYQPMNPGGYFLEPKPTYKTIEELEKAVRAGLSTMKRKQDEVLERVKTAKTADSFRQALHDLAAITRRGDLRLLQEVAGLKIDGKIRYLGAICGFFQEVADPASADLLEALYRETAENEILSVVGQLGNPASVGFFQKVVEGTTKLEGAAKGDTRISALYGMRELYLLLEANKDEVSCEALRKISTCLASKRAQNGYLAGSYAFQPPLSARHPS